MEIDESTLDPKYIRGNRRFIKKPKTISFGRFQRNGLFYTEFAKNEYNTNIQTAIGVIINSKPSNVRKDDQAFVACF